MKILLISSVFPPEIIGGAELSAYQLAVWLSRRGHEVAVVTVARDIADEVHGEMIDGLRIWRLKWPRHHTQHDHNKRNKAHKLFWHLQDHFDPRNIQKVKSVYEEFNPDIAQIHVIQGIGHNALKAFSNAKFPVFYFLHDLTLACIRACMYKNDTNCAKQCVGCSMSSRYKMSFLRRRSNVQLISPSASNLETLGAYVDIRSFRCHVVPYVDLDTPLQRKTSIVGTPLRLMYVGRLAETKGISFLLNALSELAQDGVSFAMTVIGGGPLEGALRSRYATEPWLTFTGKLNPDMVKHYICLADVVLVPSLWREIYGIVVRQAMRAGVPALVSNIGGLSEIISDGISGLTLPPGDNRAWKNAIRTLVDEPRWLETLQNGARLEGSRYSADFFGERLLALFEASRTSTEAISTVVRR